MKNKNKNKSNKLKCIFMLRNLLFVLILVVISFSCNGDTTTNVQKFTLEFHADYITGTGEKIQKIVPDVVKKIFIEDLFDGAQYNIQKADIKSDTPYLYRKEIPINEALETRRYDFRITDIYGNVGEKIGEQLNDPKGLIRIIISIKISKANLLEYSKIDPRVSVGAGGQVIISKPQT